MNTRPVFTGEPVAPAELPGLTPTTQRRLTIRLDRERGPVRLMTGFLHGLHPDLPDHFLPPLKVQYWRQGGLEYYDRIVGKHGIALNVVISDLFKKAPEPWRDLPGYGRAVYSLVRGARKAGRRIRYWEVWNEPQSGPFWSGTRNQFYETFRVAHDAIRKADPDAWVGGPSWESFDYNGTMAFLWYCRKHRVTIDFLIWHEIHSRPWRIPEHAARLRYLVSQKYPEAGVKEYHINEWGSPQAGPGTQVAFFYYLEAAGIAYAAKTIWTMEEYLDDLMADARTPKTSYRVWEQYAAGTGTRLVTESNDERLVALASRDRRGHIRVLIGRARNSFLPHHAYEKNPSPELPPVKVRLEFQGLPAGERVAQVALCQFPAKDEPFTKKRLLESVLRLSCASRGNRSSLTLPAVREDEVYAFTL